MSAALSATSITVTVGTNPLRIKTLLDETKKADSKKKIPPSTHRTPTVLASKLYINKH